MSKIDFAVRNRWSGEIQFTAQISCAEDTLPSIKIGLAVRWARDNHADLSGADLSDADLSGADLSDAVLSGADLSGADLSGADLSGADLSDADLSGADLSGADLSGADLSDADLSGADLSDAVLSGADLSGADLSGADLSDADLSGADLSGADLSGADLSDADLSGADLSDAVLRPFRADLWEILVRAQAEVPALVAALREGRVNGSTYSGSCACLVGTLEKAGARDLPHDSGRPAEQWFLMIQTGDKPSDDTAGGFAARMALEWTLEFCRLVGIDPDSAAQTQAVSA